jgi:hypothetical protein
VKVQGDFWQIYVYLKFDAQKVGNLALSEQHLALAGHTPQTSHKIQAEIM